MFKTAKIVIRNIGLHFNTCTPINRSLVMKLRTDFLCGRGLSGATWKIMIMNPGVAASGRNTDIKFLPYSVG
jgi:hypothetical protein